MIGVLDGGFAVYGKLHLSAWTAPAGVTTSTGWSHLFSWLPMSLKQHNFGTPSACSTYKPHLQEHRHLPATWIPCATRSTLQF